MKKYKSLKWLANTSALGLGLALTSPAMADEHAVDGSNENGIVYENGDTTPKPVPDGGATALLLAAGIASVAVWRRSSK